MVKAHQSYHPQVARAIITMALFEARKEVKRRIQREGRVKLSQVPAREINAMARALVMERRDEFLARAKASSVVQDELRRLQAKEEQKQQRAIERNSATLQSARRPDFSMLSVWKRHARKGRQMIVGYVRVSTDGRDARCAIGGANGSHRQPFRHFMNLLNRAVYGAAFRRHGKRLRVLPVLEKGEVRTRTLNTRECGTSGRWHIHCAIELPSHLDAIALEKRIRRCWTKVEWGYGRILVRDGANAGWVDYMLKDQEKSVFDGFLDCIVIEMG